MLVFLLVAFSCAVRVVEVEFIPFGGRSDVSDSFSRILNNGNFRRMLVDAMQRMEEAAQDLDDEAEADMDAPELQNRNAVQSSRSLELPSSVRFGRVPVLANVAPQRRTYSSTAMSVPVEQVSTKPGFGFVARVCAVPSVLPSEQGTSSIQLIITLAAPTDFVELVLPGSNQVLKWNTLSTNRRVVVLTVARSVFVKEGHLELEIRSSVKAVYATISMSSSVGMTTFTARRPCIQKVVEPMPHTTTRPTAAATPYTAVPYAGHRMYLAFFFPPMLIFLVVLIVLSIVRCCCCRNRNRNHHHDEHQQQHEPTQHHHAVFSVPPPMPHHVQMYSPVPAYSEEYVAKPQITQLSVYPTQY